MKKNYLKLGLLALTLLSLSSCNVDDVKNEIKKYYPHDGNMYFICDDIEGGSYSYIAPKSIEIKAYYFEFEIIENKGLGPFTFNTVVGKHTPALSTKALENRYTSSAEFRVYKAISGRDECIYKVKFERLTLYSYNVDCGFETFSLYCDKVTVTTETFNFDNSKEGTNESVYTYRRP